MLPRCSLRSCATSSLLFNSHHATFSSLLTSLFIFYPTDIKRWLLKNEGQHICNWHYLLIQNVRAKVNKKYKYIHQTCRFNNFKCWKSFNINISFKWLWNPTRSNWHKYPRRTKEQLLLWPKKERNRSLAKWATPNHPRSSWKTRPDFWCVCYLQRRVWYNCKMLTMQYHVHCLLDMCTSRPYIAASSFARNLERTFLICE